MLKCSAFALLSIASASAFAADPVSSIRGPETPDMWFSGGQAFIKGQGSTKSSTRRAKNVISFVGDGMGISTITASRILEGELKGTAGPERNLLSFETFPNAALSRVYQWDQQTPDSAPTSTAIHTGYKSRDGMLSVLHTINRNECSAAVSSRLSAKTIAEYAADLGKDVGLVSTAYISHATPAALYAHTSNRGWYSDTERDSTCDGSSANSVVAKADRVKDISLQLLEPSSSNLKTRLKVAMGGGRWYLLPKTQFDPEYPTLAGKRSDGRDLTAEWVASSSGRSNAKYVWNKNDFDAVTASNTDYLLGLFEPEHMNYEADRATHDAANNKGGEPSLTDMTLKALDILKKNKNGFFLHVEAGRIDHAHHSGNAKRALLDTVELSKAVSQTVDYLKTNGLFEDTLIIVTADHSHTLTIAGYPHRGNPILGLVREVPRTDGSATALQKDAMLLPYTTLSYANGPGYLGSGTATISVSGASAVFSAGLKSFRNSADGTGLTTPAYDSFGPTKSDNGASRVDLTNVDTTALNFMQEAAVPFNSETHGGEDVAIFAIGPWSHYVRGSMEQHYIFHVMAKAFGITKF